MTSCEATVGEHEIDFTENFESLAYQGLDQFKKVVKIEIIKYEENHLEFDIIGVNCSLANALRRILLAEVPTMAIEKVWVFNNTTLFQDEFLSHRLGLIPIKADPRLFEYKAEGDSKGTPKDTIVFNLKLKCVKNKTVPQEGSQSQDNYQHRCVYTKDLVWEPIGNQSEIFSENPIKPVDDDILVAKLSAGQELDLQMHCVKGIGRDHAKFSPVATASYRLLPRIQLLDEIEGEDADLLQKCFSKGVIEVKERKGKRLAKVVNSRLDSGSRNVFRYPQLKDRIKMTLIRDHFIFNVESTGALPAHELVTEAMDVIIGKCQYFLKELDKCVT